MANIFVSLFILVIGAFASAGIYECIRGSAGQAVSTAIFLGCVLLAFLNYKKDFFKLKK